MNYLNKYFSCVQFYLYCTLNCGVYLYLRGLIITSLSFDFLATLFSQCACEQSSVVE